MFILSSPYLINAHILANALLRLTRNTQSVYQHLYLQAYPYIYAVAQKQYVYPKWTRIVHMIISGCDNIWEVFI